MAAKKTVKSADVPVRKYTPHERVIIGGLLKLIKREGRVRVRTACGHFHYKTDEKKSFLRGFMTKLVEEGLLFSLVDETITYYYANRPNFYSPTRLVKVLPVAEVDRIASHVDDTPRSLEDLTDRIYGDRKYRPMHIVDTVLRRFTDYGLIDIRKVRRSKYEPVEYVYVRSERGREFGVDTQTLITLGATALENELSAKAETDVPDPAKLTLAKLEQIALRDLQEKRIATIDVSSMTDKNWKLLLMAELLMGNQFTDYGLLRHILKVSKPDITVLSGLVQGNFAAMQKDKRRVLIESDNMNKVGHQLVAAGNAFGEVEKSTTGRVFYTMGDDDVAIAQDYATLAQLAEGKIWQFGVKGSLSKEQQRRLWIKEYYAKFRIQLEVIWPYQYRVGRGLLNRVEVESRIGVRKSEYRLIIEILVAQRRGFPFPPAYEKIVDIKALTENEGKRFVTPDALSLRLANGREMLFTHNTNFSAVTQYVDPIYSMESSIRQRLVSGHKVPFLTVDFQQEMFYMGYLGDEPKSGGHWFMTLPGMQNSLQEAEYKMKAYNRGVLTSKSHRQNTFRKKLAIPGAPEFQFLEDGRIRLRIINNKIRRILQEQRNQPEVHEVIALVTDAQHGSGTMVPEIEAKYMDYALYERRGSRLYENGDILHGTNYPQHFAENRPWRLTSMNSQKEFTLSLQMPLIQNAPNLREFGAWLGNHEWNSIGRHLSGTNDLEFLVAAVRSFRDGLRAAGKKTSLQDAFSSSRIRVGRTFNPTEGDMVNWPYYATTIGGFKIAISHLWQLWGGGRTPVDKQRKWLTGLAYAAGDIDFMFGGHYHSIWLCQEGEKLCAQLGSTASQSGYEFVLGCMSTTMCTLIEISNREGVTLEFVPWEFLHYEYKCKSPFLKGKDDQLLRPKKGTIDYKFSRMSPFIEALIDEQTQHIEV